MMRHFKFFTGLEFVFGAFLIYYVVEELLEVKSRKLGYFSSFHNCLDVCVIVVILDLYISIYYIGQYRVILTWELHKFMMYLQISIATIGFNIYEYGKASSLLKMMLAEPELYTDFSYLVFWSKTFQQCAGLSIFMGFVKIFKYISFNKTMSQLAGTLKQVDDMK